MKKHKLICLTLTLLMLLTSICTNLAFAADFSELRKGSLVSFFSSDAYISMEIDNLRPEVNDIINVEVRVNKIENLSGYQINIKYDPEILEPVKRDEKPYGKTTMFEDGDIIKNDNYAPFSFASNVLNEGILNFSNVYTELEAYRKSGKSEDSGVLGYIGFRVLQAGSTNIKFDKPDSMPGSIEGTVFFDWNGNKYSREYNVKQPSKIVISVPATPTPASPTPTVTPTPVSPTPATPTPTVTPTPASPTPKTTSSTTPTSTPQLPQNAYISLEIDKSEVYVNDIIKASIKVNNIKNLASYQINIKYDPELLQPIDINTKAGFTENTMPANSTLIINEDHSILYLADNNLARGILNFSKAYTDLESYRNSGRGEETGSLGIVGFKVLKAGDIKICFEDTMVMPNAVKGTILYNWYGQKYTQGYDVKQPPIIKASSLTPTPTATKKPSEGGNVGGGSGGSASTPKPSATPSPTPSPTPSNIVMPTPSEIPAVGRHIAYVKGYTDGAFRPEKNITRAEAAAIFAKLLGAEASESYNGTYRDIDNTHWAAWAIQYVSEHGLFKGYPDGTFRPNQNITRAEFATVVYNFIELSEDPLDEYIFKDAQDHWAREYIEQLAKLKYINGYPDGTFRPNSNIKRSESVALINRVLKRGPLYNVEQKFPDVPSTHWAYNDIAEAAFDHDYVIDELGDEKLVD